MFQAIEFGVRLLIWFGCWRRHGWPPCILFSRHPPTQCLRKGSEGTHVFVGARPFVSSCPWYGRCWSWFVDAAVGTAAGAAVAWPCCCDHAAATALLPHPTTALFFAAVFITFTFTATAAAAGFTGCLSPCRNNRKMGFPDVVLWRPKRGPGMIDSRRGRGAVEVGLDWNFKPHFGLDWRGQVDYEGHKGHGWEVRRPAARGGSGRGTCIVGEDCSWALLFCRGPNPAHSPAREAIPGIFFDTEVLSSCICW